MLSTLEYYLTLFKDFLWSVPLLLLLIGIGAYFTFSLRGLQFRYLFHALSLVVSPSKRAHDAKSSQAGISSFESLMTALAGAIGTGNITGIAIAVSIGGFGALFWMWIIAFFGMITAYAESLLAVKYRQNNKLGAFSGGPMYTLSQGLGMKKTAAMFAVFGLIASFGIGGTVQSNSVAQGIADSFQIAPALTGLIMAVLAGSVVLAGINGIGKAAGILVPFMAVAYIGAGLSVLACHIDKLIPALKLIVTSAFTGQTMIGGFAGSSFLMAVQQGVSTGIFANEAGLGSLAIASSSSTTKQAAQQGMLAISGVFIATMLICTITGLTLAVTEVLGSVDQNGALITGSSLTIKAFQTVQANFGLVVILGMTFFAFTTVLAWAYYGEKCCEYLFGLKAAKIYRWLYTCSVFFGAIMSPSLVWVLANLANGLMALPNLYSIYKLAPSVSSETKIYLEGLKKQKT